MPDALESLPQPHSQEVLAGGDDSVGNRLKYDRSFREKYNAVMQRIAYARPDGRVHQADMIAGSKHYESILANWNVSEGGAVLDIGCGQGNELEVLEEHFRPQKLIGMDSADYRKQGTPGEMVIGSIDEGLPFEPQSLDAVHCKDALVHVADQRNFFRNIATILKPGGKLLITTSEVKENYFPALYVGFNVLTQTGKLEHTYNIPFTTLDDFLNQAGKLLEEAATNKDPNIHPLDVGMPYFKISRDEVVRLCNEAGLVLDDQQVAQEEWAHEDKADDWFKAGRTPRQVLSFVKHGVAKVESLG